MVMSLGYQCPRRLNEFLCIISSEGKVSTFHSGRELGPLETSLTDALNVATLRDIIPELSSNELLEILSYSWRARKVCFVKRVTSILEVARFRPACPLPPPPRPSPVKTEKFSAKLRGPFALLRLHFNDVREKKKKKKKRTDGTSW